MIIVPYLLMVLGTATSLLEGVFIKRYNSKHQKGGFIFTALVSFGSMLFFVITNTDGWDMPPAAWGYAIAAGIAYCTASLFTYMALGCGSFAMSMLLLSYNLVITIGYGMVFLGDWKTTSVYTYIGFVLIFISLFFNRGKKEEGNNKISVSWVIYIVLSIILSGLYGVIVKVQQLKFEGVCDKEFSTVSLAFSAVVLFIIGIIKDGKDFKYIMKHGAGFALAAGASNGITNFLTLVVNSMSIPFAIISPLRSGIRIVFSFAISLIIFREKFLKRQIFGVILSMIALVLLSI